MTADAASPDTPTDPRDVLWREAYEAAKPGIQDYQEASPYCIAGVVIDKLIDAGLLSLSGDSTRDGSGSLRSDASGAPAGYIVVRHHDGEPDEDVVYHSTAAARLFLDDTTEDEDWRVYEIREASDAPR